MPLFAPVTSACRPSSLRQIFSPILPPNRTLILVFRFISSRLDCHSLDVCHWLLLDLAVFHYDDDFAAINHHAPDGRHVALYPYPVFSLYDKTRTGRSRLSRFRGWRGGSFSGW